MAEGRGRNQEEMSGRGSRMERINGGLSNGLRSSGKTEENACRQMGNPYFWSISGPGQMVKSFSHLSNVYIRFYEVNAVYGQMGTSFYHLSELFAESGQTEN